MLLRIEPRLTGRPSRSVLIIVPDHPVPSCKPEAGWFQRRKAPAEDFPELQQVMRSRTVRGRTSRRCSGGRSTNINRSIKTAFCWATFEFLHISRFKLMCLLAATTVTFCATPVLAFVTAVITVTGLILVAKLSFSAVRQINCMDAELSLKADSRLASHRISLLSFNIKMLHRVYRSQISPLHFSLRFTTIQPI